MNSKTAKFLALSGAEKRVFLSAWLSLPLLWAGLRVLGLNRLQTWLQRISPPSRKDASAPAPPEILRLGALVNQACAHACCPVTCLTRSLCLWWALRRRGVGSQLRIGVRFVQGELDAHAWVEYAGAPINDTPDVAGRFAAFGSALSPDNFQSP